MGFKEKVFSAVNMIPKGETMTYGKVAEIAGNSMAARAVGNILNKNKNLIIVPCHRVVRSDGRVGGYAGGTKKKIKLLKSEGLEIKSGKIILT